MTRSPHCTDQVGAVQYERKVNGATRRGEERRCQPDNTKLEPLPIGFRPARLHLSFPRLPAFEPSALRYNRIPTEGLGFDGKEELKSKVFSLIFNKLFRDC